MALSGLPHRVITGLLDSEQNWEWLRGNLSSAFVQVVGDNSASTFTITHNLHTRDLIAQVRETGSPYGEPGFGISFQAPTLDTVTIIFPSVPTLNQYTVTILAAGGIDVAAGGGTGSGSGIATTFFDAKGDLLTATADDTPALLAVGADGDVLTADSTTVKGVKWATPSAAGATGFLAQAKWRAG